MTKVLVIGMSFINTEARRDLAKLWWKLVRQNNPDVDVLIVDPASAFDPKQFLPDAEVFRFDDNIGPISQGQRDGSGRSFCYGLERAIVGGYDYAIHWELDFLFAPPVMPIIEKMKRTGVKVVSPGFATPYQFLEWGISFFDVNYIRESKFIERYDWPNTPRWPIAEIRLEKLFGDEVFVIPFRGVRNETNIVNMGSLSNNFPYGPPDWITHCDDLNLYYHFLNLNNLVLL